MRSIRLLLAGCALVAAVSTIAATPPDLLCVIKSLPYHCDPPPR